MFKTSCLTCGLLLAATCLVDAQEVIREKTRVRTTPSGTQEVRRISKIIGSNVRLRGTNNFGKVSDVILNDNGAAEYVVVSSGDRYVMLPWGAADLNYGQGYITYDVAPQAIQPLYFTEDAWPNVTDPQYTTRIRTIFPNVRRSVPVGPAPGTPVPPPGARVLPPGAAVPASDAPVIDQKVKVNERTGKVKVKEKVRD